MWNFIKGLFGKKPEVTPVQPEEPVRQQDARLTAALAKGNALAEKIRQEHAMRKQQYSVWRENNTQLMSLMQSA